MGPIYLIHINIQELAPKQSFETNSSLDEFKDCSKQELNNNLLHGTIRKKIRRWNDGCNPL